MNSKRDFKERDNTSGMIYNVRWTLNFEIETSNTVFICIRRKSYNLYLKSDMEYDNSI